VKIAALLSGGVDSSVALGLLRREGHDVVAFYLKVWLEDELAYLGHCPWEEDLAFAREVCRRLDVPLEVRSLQREYWDEVVRYAIDELRAGRTPSPDVLCNQRVKFGAFLDSLGGIGEFDRVASGHYARVDGRNGSVLLRRGVDPVKDQTYFLSHLSQEQLRRAVFPVGGFSKPEVRALARELDLPNQGRPDSQGICFLGKIRYPDFVRHHLGEREGDVVDADTGKALGKHRGYWFHTIGQRSGLGLSHGPWFVTGKDVAGNVVYVAHASRVEESARDSFDVVSLHWISGPPEARDVQVRVRHGERLDPASLELGSDSARVRLARKERGIAPGQFAVFYDGDVCLGGATIAG
jgi:tRNA-specific 2-thiouridylase